MYYVVYEFMIINWPLPCGTQDDVDYNIENSSMYSDALVSVRKGTWAIK